MQPLVQHFFDDPWFVNAVHTRYNELLDNGLEAYLTGRIDELAQTIEQSAKRISRNGIYGRLTANSNITRDG